MKSLLKIAIITMLTVGCAANGVALTGRWRGELNTGLTKLALVFNFGTNADGSMSVTIDSPQQNVRGIPAQVVMCTDDSLKVQCKMIGAGYSARILPDRIDGTFEQNGFRLHLSLTPEEDLLTRRPQTPVPPFPYTARDTVFYSDDGTRLAATLTVPDKVPVSGLPVVVMVTGSGPQNRDEELFEHRPFAVIADCLARKGIASLRYDDRGVGASKGNFKAATTDSFKADAAAALRFVRSMPQFSRHGILGHSEGGTIALLVGAQDKPDFIVSLAGVSVPVKEVLLAQNARSIDKAGFTESQKEASLKLLDILFDEIKRQYQAGVSAPIDVDAICRENTLDVPPLLLQSVKQSMQSRNAYFDNLISLDPTDCLHAIQCPVLAINGTRDTQVDAQSNLASFTKNVRNVQTKCMEGLNHLLQHADTGDAAEYGQIRETVAPEVLDIITAFILGR